jgi:hypothetical protein
MLGRRRPWARPDAALQCRSFFLGCPSGRGLVIGTYYVHVNRYLAISLSSYLASDSYTTRHLSAHRLVVVAPQLLLDFSPSAAQRRSPSLRLQPAATQYSTFSIGPKHSLVEHLPRKWKVGREASLGRTGHCPTDCALTHVHLEPQKGTRFVLTFMPRFLCRAYYTPAQAKTMRAYPYHAHAHVHAHTDPYHAPSLRCTQP